MSKAELLAVVKQAEERLRTADIPSHPMRDKCFKLMGEVQQLLRDAIAKACHDLAAE